MGTFALYQNRTHAPNEAQIRRLAFTAQLTVTAIRHERDGQRLAASEQRFRSLSTYNPTPLCYALLHLANAAMLVLMSQKLSQVNLQLTTPLTCACVVAAQLVMVPMALLVGAKAEDWGANHSCWPVF